MRLMRNGRADLESRGNSGVRTTPIPLPSHLTYSINTTAETTTAIKSSILLSVRDYYKRCSKPINEWLHFEITLIDLMDDIEHEQMLYEWILGELLRPIIVKDVHRITWLGNADDPR